jgi:hypothetical protein
MNLTVVNADWKEVWYNAVKRICTITYFTQVLNVQKIDAMPRGILYFRKNKLFCFKHA